MRSIKLEIADRSLTLDGIETCYQEVVNWPFPGPRFWFPGRPCLCGNNKFVFFYRDVEEEIEGGEIVKRREYGSVCPTCYPFQPNTVIVGEIDYNENVAYIYEIGKRIIPNRETPAASLGRMNAYVPGNVEWPGVGWLDAARYLPTTAERPSDRVIDFRKARARGKKRRNDGPTLKGFT